MNAKQFFFSVAAGVVTLAVWEFGIKPRMSQGQANRAPAPSVWDGTGGQGEGGIGSWFSNLWEF